MAKAKNVPRAEPYLWLGFTAGLWAAIIVLGWRNCFSAAAWAAITVTLGGTTMIIASERTKSAIVGGLLLVGGLFFVPAIMILGASISPALVDWTGWLTLVACLFALLREKLARTHSFGHYK